MSVQQFRCYFLDMRDRIVAAEVVDAADDQEAIELALAMLKARPRHYTIEVWRGAKRIYRGWLSD
jgi:hypothetical protein